MEKVTSKTYKVVPIKKEEINKDIIPFDFKGHDVRVIKDEKGNPWFCAKDICKVLDIVWKRSDTLSAIPDGWKGSRSFRTTGGIQEIVFINEAALYKFIFRSNKPKAHDFTNWIAGEVIPSIRKYGGYVSNVDLFIDTFFTVPDNERPMLKQMLEDHIQMKKQIEQDKPKIEFYEALVESADMFDIGTTAKILNFKNIGRNKVFEILRNEGVLMSSDDDHYNEPYQDYINRGWFKVVMKKRDSGQFYKKVYVFGKGMKGIRDIISNNI